MVEFVGPLTAAEGEYNDPKGYKAPYGGYVFVPEPSADQIPTDTNPRDVGLGGLPDPPLPNITPPQVITLTPVGEVVVPFDEFVLGQVPVNNFGTYISFTKDSQSFDNLTEIPLTITGALQGKLEEANLPPVTGKLNISYANNVPVATMQFNIANSTEAIQVFNDNPTILNSLAAVCEYNLLYEIDVQGYRENFEYSRFEGNFGVPISIDMGQAYESASQPTYSPAQDLVTPEFPDVLTELSEDPKITIVTNKSLNTSIKVPTALVEQAEKNPKPILVGNQNVGDSYLIGLIGGDRRFNSGRFIDLGNDALAKKRDLYGYTTGITDSNYSFFQVKTDTATNLQSHSLELDYSVTSQAGVPLIFSNNVDETVALIDLINRRDSGYSDYPYNAITNNKIEASLDSDSLSIINSSLNLGGKSLKTSMLSSVKEALIRGEQAFFRKEDLEKFNNETQNRQVLQRKSTQVLNNIAAMDIILQEAISIYPDDYTIKAKNRLANWKTLAEDVNKRIIYKTSNEIETSIYIPNNEKIVVKDACGVSHDLEMQDGDFFNASVLNGDDRLTVFSDIANAKVLDCTAIDQASLLADDEYFLSLECTSTTSQLNEYAPDVSSNRQDYYFLKLDKDTIEDSPDTSLFFRRTTASYDYATTGLNDYVKHKAFPYGIVYLRHDDMIFNHLESSNKAKLIFRDLTLDNFSNTPDIILPRLIPQYILLVPTDSTLKCPYHTRSKFIDFNTRRVNLKFSPFLTDIDGGMANPPYLTPTITTTDSVNFSLDIQDGITYQEGLEYSLDTDAITNIKKYKNDAELLPRTLLPVPAVLQKLNTLKTDYALGQRDSISLYDLYSNLDPKTFRSLSADTLDFNDFKSKLRYNIVTDDKDTNKTTFVSVKEVSNIDKKTPTLLENPTPSWTATPTSAGEAVDVRDAIDAPVVRGGYRSI